MRRATTIGAMVALCVTLGRYTLAASVPPAPPLLPATADVVAYAKPAVVFIRHRDQAGEHYIGTGFLVHEDGVVVTCAHLVEAQADETPKASDKIWVRLYDGSVHEAEVWTLMPESDIAVLKIDVKGYPYLDVNTSVPRLGDEVIVIGFPLGTALGTEPSVTKGIISALRFLDTAYQVDAAVNPGNSGGPVLNSNGDVVGALSFKVRGAEGMAFAVSAALFPLRPSFEGKVPPTGLTDEENAGVRRLLRGDHIRHNSRPPLCRAADAGDSGLVRKLLAEGARLDPRDNGGNTPLMYAAMLNHRTVAEDPGYQSRKLEIAKLLLEKGADVNSADDSGDTALHDAAGCGFPDCVRLLIQRGANVNARDVLLWTPLHRAVFLGGAECVELLLKNGANVALRDLNRDTPLGRVKRIFGQNPSYEPIVRLLRQYGATE